MIMAVDPISAVLSIGSTILDRVIPDKNARAKAQEALETMDKKGELAGVAGQLAINKEEAKHPSIFVSGWRPFIGWTCGVALAMKVIVLEAVLFFAALYGYDTSGVPQINTAEVFALLGPLLGIGTLRTFEKIKGVNRDR